MTKKFDEDPLSRMWVERYKADHCSHNLVQAALLDDLAAWLGERMTEVDVLGLELEDRDKKLAACLVVRPRGERDENQV